MRRIIPSLLTVLAVLSACGSLDCPLNNIVNTKYRLKGVAAKDTITVSTTKQTGNDSVLINKDVKPDSLLLRMSYTQPEDVLYFEVRDSMQRVFLDTVRIQKENQIHFESVDCSPNYFHTITGVTTTHHKIDSIVINRKDVNYDATKEHFTLYFGSRRR